MQSLRHAADAPDVAFRPVEAAPPRASRWPVGIFRTDAEFRRRALRRRDAWWVVLVIDPLALPVLAVLARIRWVTPMRITAAGALIGAGSVAAFFSGHLVLGALLFELRYFLDCLDGKLARVRGVTSARGAFLDFGSDVLLISAAMAALGWRLAFHPTGGDHVPIGLSAACTFACLVLFWLILYDVEHRASGTTAAPESRSGAGAWLHARRMYRLPRTMEVETLLLFIAPLTGSVLMLEVCFALALTYYTLACVHLFLRLVRQLPGPAPDPEG